MSKLLNFCTNILVFTLALSFIACSKKSTHNNTDSNSPIIISIIDLGNPLYGEKSFKQRLEKLDDFSDGKYSPGELLYIKGKNLNDVKLTIDNKAVQILESSTGGIFVKVPLQLAPLLKHSIQTSNNFGVANKDFHSQHYIAAADTDGNKIHFLKTNPIVKGQIEETDYTIEHERVLFNLLHPSKNFILTIGVDSKVNDKTNKGLKYTTKIKIIDLNYPGNPKTIKSFKYSLNSTPIAAKISDGGKLLLLGKNDIMTVDFANPLAPIESPLFNLPKNEALEKTTFVDAIFLNNDKQIVALEAYSNKAFLFDNVSNEGAQTHFRLTSSLQLIEQIGEPLSLGLTNSPNSRTEFWVTTGINLRLIGNKISRIFSRKKQDSIALEHLMSETQLISVASRKGKLTKTKIIPLPEKFIPFATSFNNHKQLLVSGISSQFLQSSDNESWSDILKSLLPTILEGVKIGSVITVDPVSTKIEKTIAGVGIYHHLSYLEGKGAVFTLVKITGDVWFPYVKTAWGVGIQERGTYSLRKLGNRAIFPPYSLGQVVVQ